MDSQNQAADSKRPRIEVVTPPAQESLPEEGKGLDVEALKKRFEALEQEVRSSGLGSVERQYHDTF